MFVSLLAFNFNYWSVYHVQVNMPIDYETEKHRGFAFIEFELPEDAQVSKNLSYLVNKILYFVTELK